MPSSAEASSSAELVLLVLHGEAADSALMRKMLKLTGWLPKLEAYGVKVEFLDALHVMSPIPELFSSLAATGEYAREKYFGWGLTTEDENRRLAACDGVRQIGPDRERAAEDKASRAAAVCESVRHVERWIEQHPVSGICGICAGGFIAAAVAARSPSLQFFINFCSSPWELLPKSMDLEVP